ncbi:MULTISPECIES: response regulator [Bacteroides]|jgi:signal transduction histidine kinase/ligand-binding sensor domain-containing protein/AraC-like DNA-binding protein|uniref:hybrid sensor histidine kinase/response regulator transcription factor n=1 Tax=Bacteroides TaxID=816 RepID=UPI000E4D012B|nr:MULTISPECIES: response regulator [Bacteroides]RHL10480.1 hybrid sensor histidine kinase/response regulator [Bacteroides sp. AF39-11AC]
MRKLVLFFIFTYFSALCIAQTYKYLGVEDGLSNRRVYAIQKGPKGYMWFLTHNGIDRYDGKNFKQYRLIDSEIEVNSMLNLSWLYVGTDGTLWEIGKKGRVFRYDAKHDRFQLVYKLPDEVVKGTPTPVSYGFIDSNNVIWLCNEEALYLYDTKTEKTTIIKNHIGESITDIEQIDSEHYFIGTDVGIHHAELKNNVLNLSPCNWLDNLKMQVNELFLHKESRKLFIGTFQKGVYLYDMNIHQAIELNVGLKDVSITRIKAFNDKEILIATDGAGVYKLNVDTYKCEPYIVADYSSYNSMNGNSIYDLYVDGDRIWMANYPIGITVRNNQYTSYQWIKHSIGNKQSLINDQVNAIIEDHEGDLWFATNNGISLYSTKNKQWHSFLSIFDNGSVTKNHVFISLCEVSPGIIWAGGYSSGIYQINKKQMSVGFFTPSTFGDCDIRPDKYIRSIMKDSDGNIWSGGYYNLKRIDFARKNIRAYPGLSGITDIKEKDKQHMWIGTATGLYLLDTETGKFEYITMPIESFYINALYQSDNGLLYIGTSNSGLLIYDHEKKSFEHFHKDNCPLISNNIYSILSDGEKSVLLSTENSLTSYYPEEKVFHNWTKEQGLKSDHFNATSGILRKNGDFILGSTDGAIEFHKDMMIPRNYKFQMIFSDLRVFYQTVYPGDEGSPLEVDIDDTKTLKLKYNQNIFSLRISAINYDYPSLILYSWKLDGFYDGWSRPEKDCLIRFTNLSPGKYTLRVRAISSEDRRIVLEERNMDIIIEQPIWLSIWALLLYAIVIAAIVTITLRVIILRKQRKTSDEKIRFFINTAHDIRTPLTLIKAPLEELSEKEDLTPGGRSNMNTAIRNVNALLRLTTNLINFERADTYSSALYVSEYELSTYMEEMINAFRAYADVKHVSLTYESNFRYMNVWLDKDKMDSILKNLISNALKYTPEGGSVHIFAAETEDNWSVEVKDTGIGIPASEQKKLFRMHFRGSNAINSKVTGSGIGLLLVWKLVRLHKGKINFSSTEGKGSCIKVIFPKKEKYYRKAVHSPKPGSEKVVYAESGVPKNISLSTVYDTARQKQQQNGDLPKILIVEDNDELREYLRNTLSDDYIIQVCSDGKQALDIVKEYMPNMIISDIMMPEMRGDELCHRLKNDIETSHIPIILLTALNNDRNIIEGLKTRADEYIVKPFNIGILRATIANILTNRSLLRHKYANLELNDEESDTACINCSTDIDWKFISTVKKSVEDNMDNSSFTVDVLCNLLNMSRTSFYNKIKALTDQAPADYIRLIRLKRAAQLLKEQQHSITEVAEMTGFSDAKYFREVFKKHFNVSPSQYAKQKEEDNNDKMK